MTEQYFLNGASLPTIPTPHDCVIKALRTEGEYLIFEFEDNIALHDSILDVHPNAKSLIMRFHMTDSDFALYLFERKKHAEGYFCQKAKKLFKLTEKKRPLTYLYHSVRYCGIILELFLTNSVLLELEADRVEMEWIE